MEKLNVLDLFSGLGGWSSYFKEAGDNVITLDIERKFNPTFCADIMCIKSLKDLEIGGRFDVILASPPCNCFSIASCYRHWKDGNPKDRATLDSIKIVKHTLKLIHDYNPTYWVLENPRGMLRKVIGMPDYEISQCKYGHSIMKSTDLWGHLPDTFIPLKCNNGNPDHERASKSSKNGLPGINNSLSLLSSSSPERAKIPLGLSKAVRDSIVQVGISSEV